MLAEYEANQMVSKPASHVLCESPVPLEVEMDRTRIPTGRHRQFLFNVIFYACFKYTQIVIEYYMTIPHHRALFQ